MKSELQADAGRANGALRSRDYVLLANQDSTGAAKKTHENEPEPPAAARW